MDIAILGAGPIGLEAAARARAEGHDAVVFEAGEVGASLRQWGHVTLFTPWHMDTTVLGRETAGLDADPEAFPTGAALVARYLAPLAATLDVRAGHRVLGVARSRMRKSSAIGKARRAEDPFRLHVRGPQGAFLHTADAVIDCTGTWSDPVPAGIGGLEAPGEAALRARGRVRYGPVAVEDLARKRVALVGDGASAATALLDLLDRGARVTWLTPSDDPPGFASPEDDPLPHRRALFEAARAARARVEHVAGRWIVGFEDGDEVGVRLDDGEVLRVDAVVACTGFRPDLSLHRELQVHSCWASEGTMKLASALLATSGSGGDCLAEQASGPQLLKNPEPRFYVIGAKSYGRRSDFLLQTGHRQVEEVMALIAGVGG